MGRKCKLPTVPADDAATVAHKARMDRYVEGRLMGLSSRNAAVFAGVAYKSAAREGRTYAQDRYVIERFKSLREKLTRNELCSFAELALNVKSIAFDEELNAHVRVTASSALSRIMGFEVQAAANGTAQGLLLIPVAESMGAWEATAIASQRQLQQEVSDDAQ
jgi:hypothetical protein